MKTTLEIMKKAKELSPIIGACSKEAKTDALYKMADSLEANIERILAANLIDMEKAKDSISAVMLDRLCLTEERIKSMADGIRQVAKLEDPVGKVLTTVTRPNGLVIEKTSVALGVIAIIYESRPNVTSDAAALALKAGSCCILRGGKEAYNSASAIVLALQEGLEKAGLPARLVQLVEDTTRESANELMLGVGYIDLLIPRGGAGLIKACTENAKVPCIETGTGICHIYVDYNADLEKAVKIITNAKASRPSVCNAEEVCLVHSSIYEKFLPMLKKSLVDDRLNASQVPVELRLDDRAATAIQGKAISETDFDTEFLDYILAIGIVDSVDEAISHIACHSTGHSEAILSKDEENIKKFTTLVDSAAVYINASTRFTDGGEFGLGCEMGISTQKLHARGPMGLEELTSYKYIIHGDGQIR